MSISVIITVLDDYEETQKTIASIRATAGDIEIVVVDDSSQVPLSLVDKKAILIRNESRAGVAASRDIASHKCTGDFIFICDSHMRFAPGWFQSAMIATKAGNTVAHTCTCLGLTPSNMDISRPNGEYSGASINFYGDDRVKPHAPKQILEGVWMGHHDGDGYPVACMMGACYLLPKDFFHHVGGLKLLKGWGSDEPFLSLKWWLAGGEIRVCKSVRVGHQFRDVASYRTDQWKPLYNKLAVGHTCLPLERARKLIFLIPNSKELTEAKKHIDDDWNFLLAERAYYESIFCRSFEWYLQYFGLQCP